MRSSSGRFTIRSVYASAAFSPLLGDFILALSMAYTFFFLLGIPFWLIASTRILRSSAHPPGLKAAWAATAFFAPLVIFGLSSIAYTVIAQRLGETAAVTRGFGYFFIAVSFFAFFSPFVVSSAFKSRYASRYASRPMSREGATQPPPRR